MRSRQIDEAPGLVFAGIQGYAGHLQHVYDYAERAEAVAAVSERLAHVSSVLADAGLCRRRSSPAAAPEPMTRITATACWASSRPAALR